MSTVTFADVVHQSISFSREIPAHRLALDLLDTRWVQRLRDISQTANTRLVYMFSEHSRFGHSLGVAYLANLLMDKLAVTFPKKIEPYRIAVSAAALLHDIGHIAPGSHTAYKSWYPDLSDAHEHLAERIIREDGDLHALLEGAQAGLPDLVCRILREDPSLPPWTWQIISGGGWNVDRGNWCSVDSILAGVSYGNYNIPALIESIMISDDNQLALRENRLDAMMHFAVSRHAMYRQIYQHRVLLAADILNRSIVQRARDTSAKLPFADSEMLTVLESTTPMMLPIATVYHMREAWWRYHLLCWARSDDPVLADLCDRLLNRRLFKTVRARNKAELESLLERAGALLAARGLDPRYYLADISTVDVHSGDTRQSMLVYFEDHQLRPILDADPLFAALSKESDRYTKVWIALPAEVKRELLRND